MFLAQVQTHEGGDPIALRHRNLTTANVEFFLEEETSLDDETNHLAEAVGYLVTRAGTLAGR